MQPVGSHVNMNMRPHPNRELVPGMTPQPKAKTNRDLFDPGKNESPSVENPVYQAEIHAQRDLEEENGEEPSTFGIQAKTEEEAKTYTDPAERIKLSRTALRNHLHERISAFFMQLIDCYDTPYYYTIGKVEDQMKSTSPLHIEIDEDIEIEVEAEREVKHASAHHGTLPCVYVYPRGEWEAWKLHKLAQNRPSPKVHVKNSDTYRLNNACSGLEEVINRADIDIDGNATEETTELRKTPQREEDKKLREKAIALLNLAARKEIDPIEGLRRFLTDLGKRIKVLSQQNHVAKPEKNFIFKSWRADIGAIQQAFAANVQLYIADLLGINTHNPAIQDTLNVMPLVFPRHYQLLKTKDYYQTTLAEKIEQLAKGILGTAKKPKLFKQAFDVAMMKGALASSEKVRIIFQRFYNCSGQTLGQLAATCQKNATPALNLVNSESSKEKIKAFFIQFEQYIHNLNIEQTKFRAKLLKEIRGIKGIGVRKFVLAYNWNNRKNPKVKSLSYGQVYRIEGGCVEITKEMAESFAAILKVDRSIFMPEAFV